MKLSKAQRDLLTKEAKAAMADPKDIPADIMEAAREAINNAEGGAIMVIARALLSERERRTAQEVTWEPIETAPTDAVGCFADACLIGYVEWGSWDNPSRHVGPIVWQEAIGKWEFTETDFDMFPLPTHWTVWPATPSLSTGAGGGERG